MTPDRSKSSLLDFLAACRSMPERDRRNARRANILLFIWCVTFLPALYLLRRELVPPGPLTWAAATVPILIGVAGVLAYVRFLREADEMQRRIQFEALSIGFGAGFVACFGLELLESAGLGAYGPADAFSVMALFYLVGMWTGTRRYL